METMAPRASGADGDLLHAVMAFLDENDALDPEMDDATTSDSYGSSQSDAGGPSDSHSVSGDSPTSPTSPPRVAPTTPAGSGSDSGSGSVDGGGVLPRLQPRRPKINRSRERMRKETLALREHVLELQDRLEVLQGGVASRVGMAPTTPNVRDRESREARRLRALAWQAIAEHESAKKQAAEEERERLRALLKEQKLAFRRLRRYLSKYGAESQWAPLKKELLVDDETLADDEEEAPDVTRHDFEDISKTLPAMYLQTSGVFTDTRLDGLTSSLRDVKFQNELTPTMSVEALDSRLVPFDVAQTARAVWEFHRTKVRKLTDGEDTRLEESDNCLRRIYQSAIKHPLVTGTSRVRMETRRYVENERVVFVQSAIYDDMRVDGKPLLHYGMRQFQWTVIGPPRNFLLRHSGKTMSQVEIFEVTVPILDHVTGIDRLDLLRKMRTLCETTADVHRELERESVETILMDSLRRNPTLDSSMVQPPSYIL